MALNENYKIIVAGTYMGQLCENVFWYTQDDAGVGYADTVELAQFVADSWVEEIRAYQSVEFTWDTLELVNWSTGIEAVSIALALPGTAGGDMLPPWFVFNMSWNRRGAGYNYPSKRISGVTENSLSDGGITLLSQTALLAIGATMVGFSSTVGTSYHMAAFSPAPPLGVNPYGPGYRFQTPTSIRAVKLGTQKSRK